MTDRKKMLTDALAERPGNLLDAIPSYRVDGKPLDPKAPKEALTSLDRAPKPKEIDYSRTTDKMIIEGTAILKDGRKVTWQD